MSRTFHACWSTYVAMTICFGIVPVISLPAALHGDKDAAWIAAGSFALLLFVYFWLSQFKLVITPSKLIYSSLFTGERIIEFSQLAASDVVWQGQGAHQRMLLRLTAAGVTTRINFKVFSREAVRALFHLVGPNQSLEPVSSLKLL
jgi:hypothetical protein